MFNSTKSILIEKLGDGEVYIKNYLKLHFGGAKDKTHHPTDVQQAKVVGVTAGDSSYKVDDGVMLRPLTASLAVGTVWGIPQDFVDGGRQQSIYGFNRECIGKEGFPNAHLVAKYLRETAPSTDIKEQRINLYENVLLAEDFYDNPTALLMSIMIKAYKVRMSEKLTTYRHTVSIPIARLRRTIAIEDDAVRRRELVQLLQTGTTGCGTTVFDGGLWDLERDAEAWFRAFGPNEQIPEFYEHSVNVWKCYTYDDGHSASGSHFADHFGFINNRFIVPADINKTDVPAETLVMSVNSEVPSTDQGVKNLRKYQHWINCSMLTENECILLHYALTGNERNTPLLIDQDLHLDIAPATVAMIGNDITHGNDITYTFRDYMGLLHKLVTVHRWHEDCLNASKLLRPWFVQPATETVESHWWTHIKRKLRYPTLGLKRASIGCLMHGQAVCTTVDAIKYYEQLLSAADYPLLQSLYYNTNWYWGEFLMINNANDGHEHLRILDYNTRDDLAPAIRADALVSAVSGEEVPISTYPHCYTYILGGLDQYKRIRMSFGRLNIQHVDEYGYDVAENFVLMNTMVAPACVALICGQAGSLLDGTPYASTFTINPRVNIPTKRKIERAYNYSDLWAYGVVARWNGHNVNYYHPKRNGRHTMFCANNVNIAMPPVTPHLLDSMESYKINSVSSRDRCWGDDFSQFMEYHQMYYWTSDRLEVLAEPKWDADIVMCESFSVNIPEYYVEPSDLVADTIARLSTKFDIVKSGFHVARLNIGSMWRRNTGPSILETSTLETNEKDPPPPEPPNAD